MDKKFFENPILNSPYEIPGKHWETGADNRPTGKVIETRRQSSLRSPIPAPGSAWCLQSGRGFQPIDAIS